MSQFVFYQLQLVMASMMNFTNISYDFKLIHELFTVNLSYTRFQLPIYFLFLRWVITFLTDEFYVAFPIVIMCNDFTRSVVCRFLQIKLWLNLVISCIIVSQKQGHFTNAWSIWLVIVLCVFLTYVDAIQYKILSKCSRWIIHGWNKMGYVWIDYSM